MTRQHFKAIAMVLADHQSVEPEVGEMTTPKEITRLGIIEGLVKYFMTIDPNFKEAQFLKAACWYQVQMGMRTG